MNKVLSMLLVFVLSLAFGPGAEALSAIELPDSLDSAEMIEITFWAASDIHTNQNNIYTPCVHQDPETRQRLSQNCVWVSPEEVQVSSGLPHGQGLWAQQTWVWHKPSWRRSPLIPPESHRNLHRTGRQTLGGHNRTLCAPEPVRKEQ